MQISDSAGKTGILEGIDFNCSTDSNSYPTADKIRNVNRRYYDVVQNILKVYPAYDDSNLASLPKRDLTMVDNTHEVALPDASLQIDYLEVKLTDGTYKKLEKVDFSDKVSSVSSFTTTKGIPQYYDVLGAYIYLDPAPDSTKVTVSSGLRVWEAREVDIFTTADTTQEPGFAEPFHRLLEYGASYDWLIVNGPMEKADRYMQLYQQMMLDLRQFYKNKNRDSRTRFKPASRRDSYQ